MLNSASIGIEIVNPGRRVAPDGTVEFAPYLPAQIDLVVRLVQDIVARHGIRPDRVLGHNEVAPQRKIDPGPAFPWRVLAQAGLIAWPEPSRVAAQRPRRHMASAHAGRNRLRRTRKRRVRRADTTSDRGVSDEIQAVAIRRRTRC